MDLLHFDDLSDLPPPIFEDESDEEVTLKLPSSLQASNTTKPDKISRPVIQVDKFSGTSKENVFEFRENFYRASVVNGWGSDAQTLLLPSYLAGRAKDLYLAFEPKVKASVALMFEELIGHFNSPAIRYQAKQLASERVQGKTESVADYFQNLSSIVRKAWGNQSKGVEREKHIECFVNGLRPNIKKIFWNQEPQTIEEALNLAESREIYLKTKRKGFETNAVSAPDQKSRDNELEELRKALKELKATVASQEAEIKNRNEIIDQMCSRSETKPPQSSRNNVTCWACGSTGHFRRDCPTSAGGNTSRGGR